MDKAILEFLASGGKIVKCKPRAPGIKATRDYV